MIDEYVIRNQCKYCKFFNEPTNECWFVIHNPYPGTTEQTVEWYREHKPYDISVIEDCIVYREQGAE